MHLPYAQVPDTPVTISPVYLSRLDDLVQNTGMFANGAEAASIFREVVQQVGEHLLTEALKPLLSPDICIYKQFINSE